MEEDGVVVRLMEWWSQKRAARRYRRGAGRTPTRREITEIEARAAAGLTPRRPYTRCMELGKPGNWRRP